MFAAVFVVVVVIIISFDFLLLVVNNIHYVVFVGIFCCSCIYTYNYLKAAFFTFDLFLFYNSFVIVGVVVVVFIFFAIIFDTIL